MARILRVAGTLRERIESLGLAAFLRTTGSKGLHLVVPLEPAANWDQAKAFAKSLAAAHTKDDPKRLTVNMSKAKRAGRIFIDYLRNARGATAWAPIPYAHARTPRWQCRSVGMSSTPRLPHR